LEPLKGIEEHKIVEGHIADPSSDFTINHKKFVHVLRVIELKKLIEQKIDKQAGMILGVFLDDSKLIDKSEVFENSEVLSLSQIDSKLKRLLELYEGKS